MPPDRSGLPQKVETEAASWHARMSEPTSEEDVAEFEAWLCATPENSQVYDEIDRITTLGERLPIRLLHGRSTPMQAWQLRPAIGIAAAVALVIAGGTWLTTQGTPTAMAAVSNEGASVRGVRLRDSTIVVLDRATHLDLPPDAQPHDVVLTSGRARFDTRRRGGPLSVGVATVGIRAESAVFDVAVAASVVTVSVLAGAVEIDPDTGAALPGRATLHAGKVGTVRNSRLAAITVDGSDLRWPESRLAFDRAPLRDIIAKANLRGAPRIAFEPRALGELQVTGIFDIRDTRALSRRLAAALNPEGHRKPDCHSPAPLTFFSHRGRATPPTPSSLASDAADQQLCREDMTMMINGGMSATVALAMLGAPTAAQSGTQHYTIPAQPVSEALKAAARISGREIIASTAMLDGKRSTPIVGDYTAEQAFAALLAGTGLRVDLVDGAFVVRPEQQPIAKPPPPASEIVVTGSRIRGAPVASPVISLDRETLRDSGITSLGDAVRSIPQNFGGGTNIGVGLNVPTENGANIGGGLIGQSSRPR